MKTSRKTILKQLVAAGSAAAVPSAGISSLVKEKNQQTEKLQILLEHLPIPTGILKVIKKKHVLKIA